MKTLITIAVLLFVLGCGDTPTQVTVNQDTDVSQDNNQNASDTLESVDDICDRCLEQEELSFESCVEEEGVSVAECF